jgi:hypothetical protein
MTVVLTQRLKPNSRSILYGPTKSSPQTKHSDSATGLIIPKAVYSQSTGQINEGNRGFQPCVYLETGSSAGKTEVSPLRGQKGGKHER